MSKQDESYELHPLAAAITNRQHAIFVTEMIAHGNRRLSYEKAYPNTYGLSARNSACRLLNRPEIATAIREGLLQMKQQALLSVKEKFGDRLSDIEEKRAILAQIIRGEMGTEKETTRNGEIEITRSKMDVKDRLRAIIIDSKLEEAWNRLVDMPDNDVKLDRTTFG